MIPAQAQLSRYIFVTKRRKQIADRIYAAFVCKLSENFLFARHGHLAVPRMFMRSWRPRIKFRTMKWPGTGYQSHPG